MTPIKLLSAISICILPIISFAYTPTCDGNTYEINQCLKNKISNIDTKIDKIKNQDIEKFKKYRKNICSDISSRYKCGTFESVRYGNCVLSLSEWYIHNH